MKRKYKWIVRSEKLPKPVEFRTREELVSEKCRTALKSLLKERFDVFCVESMEAAYPCCRKQELEWDQALKDWREKH